MLISMPSHGQGEGRGELWQDRWKPEGPSRPEAALETWWGEDRAQLHPAPAAGLEAQRMVQRSYSPPLLRKHIIKTSSPSETSAKKDPRLESLFLPSLFFASVSSTFQVAYTLLNVLCVISLSCPGENLECCPIYVWCGGVDTWVPWKMKIKWCECPCECMHWGRMRR